MRTHTITSPLIAALLALGAPALAQEATAPGTPEAPHPTFHNIGITWSIEGDDDADGVVAVRYREVGAATWRDAMPLVRVPAGSNAEGYSWINRHAGSIFGLDPATTYEVELALSDPDGGAVTETLEVTTRTWPEAAPGAPEIAVDPGTLADALAAAEPGDVFVLADGTYGSIQVDVDGTAEMPIVIRAARPQGAIVDGEVRADGQAHVIIEDLLIRGQIKFNDAEAITVRGNRIETPSHGVVSYATGVRDALVVDNVILGPTVWAESSLGVDGNNLGEGVQLAGPGNVIAFNRIVGFRDCISFMEGGEAVDQFSTDVYGNDLSVCPDDGIEADFAMGNVRVYGNRITDSFMGISSQPNLGGPTYFMRNVMYRVLYQPFKLQRESTGDVILHNTSVKAGNAFMVNTSAPIRRAWGRNNLFIGAPGEVFVVGADAYDAGSGRVAHLPTLQPDSSFDHDGFGAIGVGSFEGRLGDVSFASLEEMRANTTEQNAIEVDLSVFAAEVVIPPDAFEELEVPSLALAEGSAPVDAGVALVGINDGYTGDAPDLGAHEVGHELPVYGPNGSLGSGSGSGAGGGAGSGGGSGSGAGGEDGSGPSGSGGADASGGPAGPGDAGAGAGLPGAGGGTGDAASDDGGCGCEVPGATSRGRAPLLLAALGLATMVRRRRTTGPDGDRRARSTS